MFSWLRFQVPNPSVVSLVTKVTVTIKFHAIHTNQCILKITSLFLFDDINPVITSLASLVSRSCKKRFIYLFWRQQQEASLRGPVHSLPQIISFQIIYGTNTKAKTVLAQRFPVTFQTMKTELSGRVERISFPNVFPRTSDAY